MRHPNGFPMFLPAWTKNAQPAIQLRQCFGGCCKANAFRCAEWKQLRKKLRGSLPEHICNYLVSLMG
jgi:hypothetical protein